MKEHGSSSYFLLHVSQTLLCNPHHVHIIRRIKLRNMRQAKHVAHTDVCTENIKKEKDHFGHPGIDRDLCA